MIPAAVSLLLAGALFLSAFGSSSLPEHPSASHVNSYVMSPYCPGLTLEECPSVEAGNLRSEISRRLASGSTGSELERWLVTTYGEQVLGRPRRAGIFILPAMLFAAGIALIAWTLKPKSQSDPSTPKLVADTWESDRMNRELEAFARGSE